nr:lamin tail domain-containing protein [Bacteroidota bacterium]
VASNAQWEFYVNLQFPTSSANYTDIYLMSDSANLQSTSHSGYFVRIGNTTDEISLYKRVTGTNTEIIDGTDVTTNASNNIMKIKVTRDASNLWTLQRDMTGTGSSYFTEGSVTDAAITTSSFFGIFVQQSTATFHLKHFYDDFYAGPIIVDLTPPTLVSATVISATQLDLVFSENVDLVSSQTVTNYSADNSLGNPVSAVRDAVSLNLVHLTFGTAFTNALLNTLTVSNVQDLSSNPIVTTTSGFTYFAPVTAIFRDVIINEILADETPQVGLPTAEFVEIYNRSSNTFNLNGWKFSDGSSSATLGNYNLLPGQYLVICDIADTALFTPFGNRLGVTSFPSLTNTGEALFLQDNTLTYIDSVTYDDAWYQDAVKDDGGWSLELINPDFPVACPPDANWIASVNTSGGTPSAVNSVFSTVADLTAPSVSFVSVIDATHITVCFNEALDASQMSVLTNYSISSIGTPTAAVVNAGLTCVDLTLATPLTLSSSYVLTLSNQSDCSGNALTPSTANFAYYIAKPFDIVINEIMADPDPVLTTLPNFEYVELHNRTAYSVNLNNWSFTAGTNTKLLPNVSIAPDSFIVFASTTAAPAFLANSNVVGVVSFPSLTNTGQSLTLRNPSGTVISHVTYSDTWYGDASKSEGGWSLEQIDPNNPCAGMGNWRASDSPDGGTPGKINSVNASNPDGGAPQVVRVNVIAADTIQVYFNEPLDSATMLNTSLYTIDNGIGNPSTVIVISPDFKSVKLTLSAFLQNAIIYTITVNNTITDCVGNPVGADNSARFAIPEPALPKDIVINEILVDPLTGGVDYVEIYNRSNRVIDLKTISISQFDTILNVTTAVEIITAEGYQLFPQEYLVLSENGAAVRSQYTIENPEAFLDVPNLPSMNIDNGTICLSRDLFIIDNFTYYADMHFALLSVTKGVSLERIDFDRETQDRTNWHSAAQTAGFGTPGYKNSQFNDAGESSTTIEITPEVFSPDEDGFNDVVNINYNFETPGYVANITIYDSKGRVVKLLVKSELLGSKGTYSWDGINEEREKARIGIYIIYFEVFDLKGNVKKYKKTCVLGGKL